MFRVNTVHDFCCCFSTDCVVYQSVFVPTVDLTSSPSDPTYSVTHDACVMIDSLGRFVLSEFDFNITFAIPNTAVYPKPEPINSLFVPDYTVVVTRFEVDAVVDIGGTLKVTVATVDPSVMVGKFESQHEKMYIIT